MTRNRCALTLALALLAATPAAVGAPAEANPPTAEVLDPVQALRVLKKEHEALLAQQPTLQDAAAQADVLANHNRQLEQQLQTLQAQLDGLRGELVALQTDERRQWLVIGAGVLGAGMLLGLILPALRWRRRPRRGGFH
ncbi:TIGR04211 family SH3 domain-containing protein [Immundisolibacter sp.]|uniref:TIGR04211 family SH3 domain-containing protein n=1 Tax=Immundisolibacter sp. TaxID=1934948 RepID=UPI0035631DD1